MKKKELRIRDLSDKLTTDILDKIEPFSIHIIGITVRNNTEHISLIGSGTLIKLSNFYGILTANHVIESKNYKESPKIGFNILRESHKFEINNSFLSTHTIGNYKKVSGPDLAVIEIPEINLFWFKEKKAFYNLESHSYISIKERYNDNGVWVISGCAAEHESSCGLDRNFGDVTSFRHTCWFGGKEKEWIESKFDYIESKAVYDDENEPPDSFRGVSGGGLWQVILSESHSGNFEIKDIILAGVAFYQTRIVNNHRFVRCHGRKSIYNMVCSVLKSFSQ